MLIPLFSIITMALQANPYILAKARIVIHSTQVSDSLYKISHVQPLAFQFLTEQGMLSENLEAFSYFVERTVLVFFALSNLTSTSYHCKYIGVKKKILSGIHHS